MRLLITGVGAVCHGGLGLPGVRAALAGAPFDEEQVRPGDGHAVARVGHLTDPDSAAAYRRWGQLDAYSRYGFAASRLALVDAGWDDDRAEVGIQLGTSFGCMEENQKFDRYDSSGDVVKGASPLVFKGTVDNAPAGWVAVAFRLKGPNATFVSGDGAALEALWSAEGVLQAGRAPGLLVGGVERVTDLQLLLHERDSAKQGVVPAEGAGVVLLEREDSAAQRGVAGRAELLGVHRQRGTLADAVLGALARFEGADVGRVALALPADQPVPAELAEFGDRLTQPKATLGEAYGAYGGLALAATLAELEDGAWSGRAAVHAFGEGDEHFVAVLQGLDDRRNA